MAAAYSASKAAVIALAKAIGKDVAGPGVLVNAIAPAVIETPMLADISEEHSTTCSSGSRWAGSAEPRRSRAWSPSSRARLEFSTGATFDISGGRATY